MMAKARATIVSRVRVWLERATGSSSRGREAVIPLLQSAQAEFGYVPREAMEGIARVLRMPPAVVQGIATFYAQFRFHAPGRHNVTVCRGTACHVRGSGRLLDELQALLKVRPQETTPDGEYTLETVACFGSCALAPVISVDGRVHGQLSPAKAHALVRGTRKGRSAGRTSRPTSRRGGGG
jgi:NADH-quinone oxidoreductase subunit E